MKSIKKMKVCPKCKGKRIFNNYHHIQNGVCFRCNGTGVVKTKEYEDFYNAIVFMDNIDGYIKKIDQELEWKNSRIEIRISRGISVNSSVWYEIEQLERQIEEYRKYWLIYNKIIKYCSENIVFVD